MRDLHNIERKTVTRERGVYIGYGAGMVWRVRRWRDGWQAHTNAPHNHFVVGRTLSEISRKLDAYKV